MTHDREAPVGLRGPWLISLLVVALVGCAKDDPTTPADGGSMDGPGADLARSLTVWTGLKQQRGASYSYTSPWRIYPFGGLFETRIEVRDDRVVKRSFGLIGEGPQWVEEGDQIGSHPSGGTPLNVVAPAVTIDEMHDRCARDVLPLKSKDTFVTLDFHDSGLLKGCVHQPANCADTCEQGYRLTNLVHPLP